MALQKKKTENRFKRNKENQKIEQRTDRAWFGRFFYNIRPENGIGHAELARSRYLQSLHSLCHKHVSALARSHSVSARRCCEYSSELMARSKQLSQTTDHTSKTVQHPRYKTLQEISISVQPNYRPYTPIKVTAISDCRKNTYEVTGKQRHVRY